MDTQNALRFLTALSENNHKTWFDANRQWYEQVRADFQECTRILIAGVAEIDPRIRNLDVPSCTYRINRDIRFSSDKRPYKTHLGAFICPGGKKSGYGGYYFHLEPAGQAYLGGNLLAVGAYCPNPQELDSIRTEIYDHPDTFQVALDKAEGFALDTTSLLKKAPKGYPADFAHIDWLKHKVYCIERGIPENVVLSAHLLDWILDEFQKTYVFNEIINRAIEYLRTEG